MKVWNGKDLIGMWEISRKLDGVQVQVHADGTVTSRAGKPLHHVPTLKPGTYECFLGNWNETVSRLRSVDGKRIPRTGFFRLEPTIDRRLFIDRRVDPSAKAIAQLATTVMKAGDEGLVLRCVSGKAIGTLLKVKPVETVDVAVTGIQAGKGKHSGKVGALETALGKVGTGLTDQERVDLLTLPLGTIIEVEAMGRTVNGLLRHPRFVRVRWDKC